VRRACRMRVGDRWHRQGRLGGLGQGRSQMHSSDVGTREVEESGSEDLEQEEGRNFNDFLCKRACFG
jgi:hypothetical protein